MLTASGREHSDELKHPNKYGAGARRGAGLLSLAVIAALGLSACSDDDNDDNDNQAANQTNATTFKVTVTNTSQPATGSNPGTLDTPRANGTVPLSPGAYAVFNGGASPAFVPGSPADGGTALIAEDGFPAAPLGTKVGMLGRDATVSSSGVFAQTAGNLPALEAGESASFVMTASPGDKLTMETMFVQSNDWFYGLDGLALFDGDGNAISGNVTDSVALYDAGTEMDTEPGTGADQKPAQDPTAVDQGTKESVPINFASMRHPGFTIPANSDVINVSIEPMEKVAARTFDVKITNVSTPGTLVDQGRLGGAVPLSPGIFAVYRGDTNPAFIEGEKANPGTELIAEDGFTSGPLGSEAEALASDAAVRLAGVFSQPDGNVPALEPGESSSFSVTASPGDKLTLETMFVQSNDWFYGLDGLALFDEDGDPVSGNVTDQVTLYDAGTEADTAPGTGPDQKPAQQGFATNQGPAESVAIQPARDRHGSTFTIPANDQVLSITITPR